MVAEAPAQSVIEEVRKLSADLDREVRMPVNSQSPISRDDFKRLIRIIHKLIEDEASREFRQPVFYKALGLTDYRTIVRRPMDLGTIKKNL
jgi:hypothetical protein